MVHRRPAPHRRSAASRGSPRRDKEFGDRSQSLPERTLQVFESDLHGMVPGDRLHTAVTKLVAQLSQYAFLAHCECRIGLHNSGPYNLGENRQLIVREAGGGRHEELAIEVMKLLNPVVVPQPGEVVQVCAENAELVEYDQVLFLIRPTVA